MWDQNPGFLHARKPGFCRIRSGGCFVALGVRSPILDGFFPCGVCREYVIYCDHHGRKPGRPYKQLSEPTDEARLKLAAIQAVARVCQGCGHKPSRLRVRQWRLSEPLSEANLIVICPRCFALVKGFDILEIAAEPWAPGRLAHLVVQRERDGMLV